MESSGRWLLTMGSELLQQRQCSPGELQLHAWEFLHHSEVFQVSQALHVPLIYILFAFFCLSKAVRMHINAKNDESVRCLPSKRTVTLGEKKISFDMTHQD